MSIMRSTGVRSTFASFIEVTLFFCVLSVAYFVVCFGLYHVIAQPMAKLNHAKELTQAIDSTRSSATNMVDARREMIEKASLAEATPSADAASDAKRAKRFAERAAEDAKDDISNAARLMLADSFESAGDLADSAGQIAASVNSMNAAITEAVEMTTAPEPAPEAEAEPGDVAEAADDVSEEADEDAAQTEDETAEVDEDATEAGDEAEEAPREPTPPPVHLGESVVRLVARVDALAAVANSYTKATGKAREAIQEITDEGEQAATDAVRLAAAGVFPEHIAAIGAAATARAVDVALRGPSQEESAAIADAIRAAIDEATAPDGPDVAATVQQAVLVAVKDATGLSDDDALAVAEDAAVMADATIKAVRTSIDEIGRVRDKKIPEIIETVEDTARTALDDVAGLGEDEIASIAAAAELALADALAAADLAAEPPGEKGQTPPWADELVDAFTAERLRAADVLAGSLPETVEAISAVESAATEVLSATRAARADIQAMIRDAQAGRQPAAPADWWHEADAFIALAGRIEAAADEFVVEAEAVAARVDALAEATEQERMAIAAEIESSSTAMLNRAKAVVDASPSEVWAGKDDLTELVEQMATTLEDVIADAQELAGTADAEAEADDADDAPAAEGASEDAFVANEQDPAQQLLSLAERFRRSAREVLAQCQAAPAAVAERRTAQAKTLLDLVWRIEDLATQARRRARSALAAADAAGRGQVSPGQSGSESIAQGLGEVRLGRIFQAKFPLISFSQLFGSLPWWMWVLEGVLYLLILTAYWAPSEDRAMDACELRAFALFAGVVVVSALAAMELQGRYLSRPVRLFLDILQRGG